MSIPAKRPRTRLQRLTPEGHTLSELAREHTKEAIAVLVTIMTSTGSDTARISAANALLDRGWGRPRQEVEVDLNVLDLATVIARRRRQVAEGRK
jgi:hypothetical protein